MKLRIQAPSAQPTGAWRLLDDLESALGRCHFDTLRIVVAFAKVAPMRKLEGALRAFHGSGGTVQCVFGVDQKGTSREALDYALRHFDSVRVARSTGRYASTFHPKVYILAGSRSAEIWVGSNNLTVGGTELNPESLVHLTLSLPEDQEQMREAIALWEDAVSISAPLDSPLLRELCNLDIVQSEAVISREPPRHTHSPVDFANSIFPALRQAPPRPLPPKRHLVPGVSDGDPLSRAMTGPLALVIQVRPHGNGEVFLSKTAVDQNPVFFGWPFTGKTVPKFAKNPAYPQRDPDPVVSIQVVDETGALTIRHDSFGLNTVYYTRKSEIRITVPLDVVQHTPEFSILMMSTTNRDDGYDYHLVFYVPGSESYRQLLAACDQTMPSGGQASPRRFGWLGKQE